MPLHPVRLGCVIVAGVIAAGVLAQTATTPHTAGPGNQYLASKPVTSKGSTVRTTHPEPKPAPTTATPTPQPPNGSHPVGGDPRQASGKVLYLTFDDGPQRTWTPVMLSILAKHHAKATFFQLGIQIAELPELAARVRAEGHTIGNHTYDHKSLTLLSPAKIRWELEHGPKSTCFRPPSRATNPQIAAIGASYGMRQVLWDVDTKDWEKPGARSIESAIMRGARPGAIILIHDGGGDRSQTAAALDRALTRLSHNGYTFGPLHC
jgi:peptidoglycan/xylan/chitin deacetylase (PgdA/CDA1 family)